MRAFAALALVGTVFAAAEPYEPDHSHTHPHPTGSHTRPTGYLTISREHPTHSAPPYPYVKRHTTPHITESHTWPHPTGYHSHPHPSFTDSPHYDPPARVRKRGKRHTTPHVTESHTWPHPTGYVKRHTTPHVTESHTWPHPTGYLTISHEHPTHSPPPYPYVKRHTTPHVTESHSWPHPTGDHTWPHPSYVKRHGTGYPHPSDGYSSLPQHQPTGGYSAPPGGYPSTFATATRYATTPTAQPEYIEQREEKAPLKLRCYLGLC